MSLTSALARIELDYLSNLVRTCAETVKDVDHVSTLQEDGIGGIFEKSLRVKSMIDELEVEAQNQPGWKVLAAIVTSEYRLWVLNDETPLRHNPFLSHWVEAIQRLETAMQGHAAQATTDQVSAGDIAATRLELIKRLLGSNDVDALAAATPQQLYHARYPGTPFDVRPYIRMLEEEGIYEPSPAPTAPITTLPSIPHRDAYVTDAPHQTSKLTFEGWKKRLHERLYSDRPGVFEDLTHLPIALPALDFLTTLITEATLAKHGIDAKPVVAFYIQHALRLIEYMGQPPNATVQPPRQTDIGIATDDDHGREAQSRAVRLLLLFMKNLIKRGMVNSEPGEGLTLYFEIQEICVRFMWMREVREFRVWMDEGDTTEEGEDEG